MYVISQPNEINCKDERRQSVEKGEKRDWRIKLRLSESSCWVPCTISIYMVGAWTKSAKSAVFRVLESTTECQRLARDGLHNPSMCSSIIVISSRGLSRGDWHFVT